MTATPLIKLEAISKSFGRVQANKSIDLDIHGGRILALLGENGAGKSTLMSILSGRLQPDSGRIRVAGEPVNILSTRAAHQLGIGMVYQHFMLINSMTVAQNVLLGQPGQPILLNHQKMNDQVAELAQTFGLAIDPSARVADLSMGERQRVEILKLLHRRSQVLIFDEPTAVLTPQESEQLYQALKQMAAQGKAVVFISHKLDEVMAAADDIAILRKGVVTGQMTADTVQSKADLAREMVGRTVVFQVERDPVETHQTVLRIQGLGGGGLTDVNLQLRQGEILGLVGVAGNGQKALVETICGLKAPGCGQLSILGRGWSEFYAHASWDGNLIHIPEDRRGLATCLSLDLLENFLLTTRQSFCKGPWLFRSKAFEKIKALMEEFDIQPRNPAAQARQLSGGNLQKLVLAREFYRRPRLIVAEQPTQGLDVGATEDVWNTLLKARHRAGILLVTGDLNEALSLCDRIAVLYNGRIMDTFDADDHDKIDRIGLLMAGVTA